jgi:hypothetical protein
MKRTEVDNCQKLLQTYKIETLTRNILRQINNTTSQRNSKYCIQHCCNGAIPCLE